MREILFRGKPVDTNCEIIKKRHMIHGCYRKLSNGHIIYEETDGMYGTKVDPETVGQFTRVYDRKGNKIFEGDVLKNAVSSKIGVVKQIGGCLRVECGDRDFSLFDYPAKIIGNIHDNKELIECD